MKKIFNKVTLDSLPRIQDKYPFIYIEHAKIEIDDGSIKVLFDEGLTRVPAATISAIFLGPGTSITHESVKILAELNCIVCYVAENGFNTYSANFIATSTSRNIRTQAKLFSNEEVRVFLARKMYQKRYDENLSGKTIEELMGMEGDRVKKVYCTLAEKYGVGWTGRNYDTKNFSASDDINKVISTLSHFLYGIITSVIHSLGFIPQLGIIHSGSPLPFVYDISDLYKEYFVFELAFFIVRKNNSFDRTSIAEVLSEAIIEKNLLKKMITDIQEIIKEGEVFYGDNCS